MKVATLRQGNAVVDRILETDETREGVDRLLGRWNYVQALMRADDVPDIELFRQFLAGELKLAPVEVKAAWNAIWDGATDKNWLDRLVGRENAVHTANGTHGMADLFVETAKRYGREQVELWERKFLLRFSALPPIQLVRQAEFRWWKIKLDESDWFCNQAKAGKIGHIVNGEFQPDHEPWNIDGQIVLIDTRLKPVYTNGGQKWEDDNLFCGKVLKSLRKSYKIAKYKYGSQSSRFGVSIEDWNEHIRPALAELLGLEAGQVRLERVIEGNFIPQFYSDLPRIKDGTTDTLVWYQEWFQAELGLHHLLGGDSRSGGLAHFICDWPDNCWDNRSFRPLVVLAAP